MTIPSKWRDPYALQQLVANNINPVLQGYAFPRYDSAPDNANGLFYYDTTLSLPGWNNGSAWKYFLGQSSGGNVSITGTLGVTGAATFSSTLAAGNTTITGTISTTGTATLNALSCTNNATVGGTLGVTGASTLAAVNCGAVTSTSTIRSSGGGVGYTTGAGGTVTQVTSRTTGVTLNKLCGAITLVSAAGSASWQSFTVTNSQVAATDTITVNQKSGTDLYMLHVTNVAAGSFRITFATTGGTTTEQPVFNFTVTKAATS